MEKENLRTKTCLLSGGPSCIIPLIYLLEIKGTDAKYFGNPIDSLVLCGRDSQKTCFGLLSTAAEYKTFDNMKDKAKEYYEYLGFASQHFQVTVNEIRSELFALSSNRSKVSSGRCLLKGRDHYTSVTCEKVKLSGIPQVQFKFKSENLKKQGDLYQLKSTKKFIKVHTVLMQATSFLYFSMSGNILLIMS